MWRVLVIAGMVLVTSLALAAHAEAARRGAPTVFFGMPVIGSSMDHASWISFGGRGVIVLGAGVGLVMLGFFGVGFLFAIGQASAGGIAIGQAALGVTFVVGQLAFGASGLGQLAIGGWMKGQGRLGANGDGMISELHAWLGHVLRFGR